MRHSRTRSLQRSNANAFTLLEVIVVCVILLVLLLLLLPLQRRRGGGAADRYECKNHLKRIGLALHNYHDTYRSLPPAYTVDEYGRRLHSWRTLILPYMEQQKLYDSIDLTKPWDDPANAKAYQTEVYGYRCPSARISKTHTTYLALVGEDFAIHPTRGREFKEITDGTSNTAIVLEEISPEHAVHWMSPYDTDGRQLVNLSEDTETPHGTGMYVLLVDGVARQFNWKTPLTDRQAMVTVDGGERMTDEW